MSFLPFAVARVAVPRRSVRDRLEPEPGAGDPVADRGPVGHVRGAARASVTARAVRRRSSPTSRLGSKAVDPVVQVLVLTDIVIEATVTAMLLALAVQAHKRFGSLDPQELRALRD